jgi:hypothetical protein
MTQSNNSHGQSADAQPGEATYQAVGAAVRKMEAQGLHMTGGTLAKFMHVRASRVRPHLKRYREAQAAPALASERAALAPNQAIPSPTSCLAQFCALVAAVEQASLPEQDAFFEAYGTLLTLYDAWVPPEERARQQREAAYEADVAAAQARAAAQREQQRRAEGEALVAYWTAPLKPERDRRFARIAEQIQANEDRRRPKTLGTLFRYDFPYAATEYLVGRVYATRQLATNAREQREPWFNLPSKDYRVPTSSSDKRARY